MSVQAGDWVARIGQAHVGRFTDKELAKAATDKAAQRFVGIGWVLNEKTREEWLRDPNTRTWRIVRRVLKRKRAAPDPENWPLRPYRADIDG